jgi:DNA-binding NarL/FixJ family response regulator
MTIHLLLGEDNALLREGLHGLLASAAEIDVVGSCGDLHSLLEQLDELSPDVVLTDIRMPPTWTDEGVQVARHCRMHHRTTGVILLSQYVDPGYVRSLLESGSAGRGYLLKDRVTDFDELVAAVTSVAAGGSVVDPQVIEHLVRAGANRGTNAGRLSARELEVLAEMARGHNNATIAGSLFISQRAVEKHINSIFAKLGVSTQDQAHHPRVRAVLLYLSGSVS